MYYGSFDQNYIDDLIKRFNIGSDDYFNYLNDEQTNKIKLHWIEKKLNIECDSELVEFVGNYSDLPEDLETYTDEFILEHCHDIFCRFEEAINYWDSIEELFNKYQS
jgi:hypothetical protein